MNISLPESLREYIESRVESGAYSIPRKFVRDLIRRDREQEEIEQKTARSPKGARNPNGQELSS